jgi:hypothetical protein
VKAEYVVYVVWALGALGLLNVVIRAFRNRGLAGAMLGAPVQRTVGELDLGSKGGLHKRVKVLLLEPTGAQSAEIGLQVTTTSMLSAGMSVIPLTRAEALRIRSLLSEALGPLRQGENAV